MKKLYQFNICRGLLASKHVDLGNTGTESATKEHQLRKLRQVQKDMCHVMSATMIRIMQSVTLTISVAIAIMLINTVLFALLCVALRCLAFLCFPLLCSALLLSFALLCLA